MGQYAAKTWCETCEGFNVVDVSTFSEPDKEWRCPDCAPTPVTTLSDWEQSHETRRRKEPR